VSIAAPTLVFDSKHTDRIVEVEPIAVPIWSEPNGDYADTGMLLLKRAVWSRGWRHLGDLLSIRAKEDELARPWTSNNELFVVEHAMVTAAEQDEVLKLRFAAMDPMTQMVSICSTVAAAGKAATAVSFLQRSA